MAGGALPLRNGYLPDSARTVEALALQAQENFEDLAPGAWLMSRVPWIAAEHRIKAEEAGAHAASALKVASGKTCLVVERRTWSPDHAVTVTFVRLTYPGNLHELVARFAPPRTERRTVETLWPTLVASVGVTAPEPESTRPRRVAAGKR
jgi:hypothetical protein